jgi:hypothetical protein
MFAKEIETEPAFAVSEVVSNFSWPSGSAATLRVDPAPDAGAGLDVAGVDAAGVDELVELLDELPHPANASRPASKSIETLGAGRLLAADATRELTIRSSSVGGRRQ